MDELEGKKRLVAHVDPNRRGFVKQILGAAFVPPLVATFAMDSLMADEVAEPRNANACQVEDPGYVGPNAFQSLVFDPTHGTRSNGVIGFLIEVSPMNPRSLASAKIIVGILLTPGSTYQSGQLEINGNPVCNLPATGGSITSQELQALCDFDELLQAMASGIVKVIIKILFHGEPYTLTGTVIPASPIIITLTS